jgi:hypothetical protein
MGFPRITGLEGVWIGIMTNDWLKKYRCPIFCPNLGGFVKESYCMVIDQRYG